MEPLRLLCLDDSEDDAELVVREIRRGGWEPTYRRVADAVSLRRALAAERWDLVTCDWVMPGFGAIPALQILCRDAPDLPVIIVSGQVGEEVAVEALRAGARDYVSKERLARLNPAVARELAEAAERRRRRLAEASASLSAGRLRAILDRCTDAITLCDLQGTVLFRSRAFDRMLGYAEGEIDAKLAEHGWAGFIHPDDVPLARDNLALLVAAPGEARCGRSRLRDAAGGYRTIEAVGRNLAHDPDVGGILSVSRDVTDRAGSERLLEAMARALLGHVSGSPTDAILGDVLAALREHSDSPYGVIGEILPGEACAPTLRILARAGCPGGDEAGQPAAAGGSSRELGDVDDLLDAIVRTGDPLVANARGSGPRAFLGAPLRHHGALVGVAAVANRPGGYDERHLAALAPLLSAVGLVIAARRGE